MLDPPSSRRSPGCPLRYRRPDLDRICHPWRLAPAPHRPMRLNGRRRRRFHRQKRCLARMLNRWWRWEHSEGGAGGWHYGGPGRRHPYGWISVIFAPCTSMPAISPDWPQLATTSGFCRVEVEIEPSAPKSAATALALAPSWNPLVSRKVLSASAVLKK